MNSQSSRMLHDAQPRGKDDSRDGPQDVDGGKAYVPDALADEKTVDDDKKSRQKLGCHGGDDVAVKLLVRRFGMQKNNSFPVSAEQCLADTVYCIEKRSGLHGGFY